MGFLLHFARALQIKSRQSQVQLEMMQFTKQMLVSMSNALDLRLKHLQTRAQALSAEEQALDKVLPDEIAKSAPKYCA